MVELYSGGLDSDHLVYVLMSAWREKIPFLDSKIFSSRTPSQL